MVQSWEDTGYFEGKRKKKSNTAVGLWLKACEGSWILNCDRERKKKKPKVLKNQKHLIEHNPKEGCRHH